MDQGKILTQTTVYDLPYELTLSSNIVIGTLFPGKTLFWNSQGRNAMEIRHIEQGKRRCRDYIERRGSKARGIMETISRQEWKMMENKNGGVRWNGG